MTQPGSSRMQDANSVGPWAPLTVVLVVYLVAGLDISLGGAEDDPGFGYVFLALFAATAAGAYRWRRQPRTMALFCTALFLVQAGLVAFALASSAMEFGLPVVVMTGVILGPLGIAAMMFRKRASHRL